jgi:hypothetical protein
LPTASDTNALRNQFSNIDPVNETKPTTGVSPKRFLKSNLSFAGSGTPEAGIESQLWAFSTGDSNTMLNLRSPEDREDIKSNWESFYGSFTKTIEEFNTITEFRILDKKVVSIDQVEMQLQFVGVNINWSERLPEREIHNEWKALSVTVEAGN